MDDLKFVFCSIFIVLLILAIIIISVLHKKYINSIYRKSLCLKKLSDLNNSYDKLFCDFKQAHHTSKINKSKTSFDKTNFHQIMLEYVYANLEYFKNNMNLLEINSEYLKLYTEECDQIYENNITTWKYGIQKKSELRLFIKNKLNPPTSISLTVSSEYTSPKGRNRYFDKKTFYTSNIKEAINIADKRLYTEKKTKEERAKMTDSLRYDVMKRDGFRCVICGASAQDGIKLHVDHIKPVSKGGKTEINNLRTLCERCNLGKSAKYDPTGIN